MRMTPPDDQSSRMPRAASPGSRHDSRQLRGLAQACRTPLALSALSAHGSPGSSASPQHPVPEHVATVASLAPQDVAMLSAHGVPLEEADLRQPTAAHGTLHHLRAQPYAHHSHPMPQRHVTGFFGAAWGAVRRSWTTATR
eukprot:15432249-Alexandrium_andersonii.AAC.1